ncbi:Outer membrane protein (porin) [Vibrio hangzhouensis]|uniref:Outer membrane protein (Porin) n=2 Tax=Vibrio hangzhouensis TaxID=462991 RepID=A0A1H5S5K6_9VIBR|nr:Outer membrane protein (porin) [Vibrio hangzhouensis]
MELGFCFKQNPEILTPIISLKTMKNFIQLNPFALALLATFSTNAVELYNNEGTKVAMYGAIAAQLSQYNYDTSTAMGNAAGYNYNSDVVHVEDPGSYLGFDVSHQQGDITAIVKLEWDVNFGTQSDTSDIALQQRQTYAGFAHTTFGQVTIGRQESPYMKTDKGYYAYWAGGLNMMQSDELGSRRTANTVVWSKESDHYYLGLQYQASRKESQISFGNGLNFGSVFVPTTDQPAITIDNGFGLAATYTFDFGTYIAAAYNQSNNINGKFIDLLGVPDDNAAITATDATIKQYAIAVEHHFAEGLVSLSGRYERFMSEDGAASPAFKGITDNIGIGTNVYVSDAIRLYGSYEWALDKNKLTNSTNTKVSMINVGAAWAPVPWGEVYLEAYRDDVTLNDTYQWNTGKPTDYRGSANHFFLGAAVMF